MVADGKPPLEGMFWLPEEEYENAVGHLRHSVGLALGVFNVYGQGVYIQSVRDEIVKAAEDFGLRVRGVDKPISLEMIRNRERSKSWMNVGKIR